MPGDEVVLAGAGWGAGVSVQFGSTAATVLDTSPSSLKVTVPALEGAPGTEFPVRVASGPDTSNPAPFVLGRLPLVISVSPASAAPGDLVTVAGRGFDGKPLANDVRVAGTRALVTAASSSELKVVVPRAAPGETTLDVRVPGAEHVGQARLAVAAGPDPIDFRFVAEPFEDAAGHEHALLATGLGPAFVLSASGGKSAAERGYEAERRLNEAGAALKGTVDGDVRARGLDGSPSLVVAGRDTPLLEVTLDDAAAYEEDWTGLKGRGGPITPVRVAVWWEAVARDLVLLLIRGEKPHFAADLAPEGRVFADLHPLARKSVTVGVPRQIVAEARPPVRDALRTAGLRIPATVKGPAPVAVAGTATEPGAPASPAAPAGPVLKLDGRWSGSETDQGRTNYITAVFAGPGGTFTYERALSVSQPLLGVVQQKTVVRFSVQTGAGPRYYLGKWDGQSSRARSPSIPPASRSSAPSSSRPTRPPAGDQVRWSTKRRGRAPWSPPPAAAAPRSGRPVPGAGRPSARRRGFRSVSTGELRVRAVSAGSPCDLGAQGGTLLVTEADELQGRPVAHRALFSGRAVEPVDEAAHDAAAQGQLARATQGQAQHLHRARAQDAVHLHEGARLREVDDGGRAGRVDLAQHAAMDGHTRAEAPVLQAIVIVLVEVDVLDGVEQLDALGHRALERLAAGDQAHAAGALVDDGGRARPRRGRSRPTAPPELIRPARPM